MVVVCDRLLDAGENVKDVLPAEQLTTGGEGSLPMLLLREYFERFSSLHPEENLLQLVRKVISRMFDAEIQTVSFGVDLPFRYWIRKCSLPFVLMGLTAYASQSQQPANSFRYLLWLYRLGRFFGAVDDSIDYREDERHRHPNYLLKYNEHLRPFLVPRAADWGVAVLAQWETMTPANQDPTPRQTFLTTIWGW